MKDLCEEFYEYYKDRGDTKYASIKPQITQHFDDIDKLIAQGNSIRSVYNFLIEKKIIKCRYDYFRKIYQEIKKSKESK